MPKTVLHYFDGRGRGEIVRIMLAAGNIDFESVYYTTRQQFLQAIEDGTLQFKCLPMLHIDNMNLGQTGTIIRYLARRNDMNGQTPEEMALADLYFEGSRDFYTIFIPIGFTGTQGEVVAKAEKTALPKYLPVFNDILSKSTSGYLVGSKLTYADVGFLESLLAIEDFCEGDKLTDYPHIKKFLKKIKSEDWFVRYMKDVRMKPNDDTYITTVKTVLAF